MLLKLLSWAMVSGLQVTSVPGSGPPGGAGGPLGVKEAVVGVRKSAERREAVMRLQFLKFKRKMSFLLPARLGV